MTISDPQLSRILLIENEPDISKVLEDGIRDHGFTDVVTFADTNDIVERIRKAYTRPTVLITDYVVGPMTPARFLPELKRRGIGMPTIVISAHIEAPQLNALVLQSHYAGYFAKDPDVRPAALVTQLCRHVADVGERAHEAWIAFDALREAKDLIKDWNAKALMVAQRTLAFEPMKAIAEELGVSSSYGYQQIQPMHAFMAGIDRATRYQALSSAIDQRLSALS